MKIITMYELLGMVKDGKAPKKIKYDNYIFEYDDIYYMTKNNTYLDEYCDLSRVLNEEVEILEEEKKIPEKLKLYTLSDNDSADFTTLQDFNNRDIQRTINWILDYLKSRGDK